MAAAEEKEREKQRERDGLGIFESMVQRPQFTLFRVVWEYRSL